MNALQQLIHATGFDTFGQALEFIKESRDISDIADKCCLPPKDEAARLEREKSRDEMRKSFGNIETMKAQEEINQLRAEVTAHRDALRLARAALEKIAKPALGGKFQQYTAQEAIAALDALAKKD